MTPSNITPGFSLEFPLPEGVYDSEPLQVDGLSGCIVQSFEYDMPLSKFCGYEDQNVYNEIVNRDEAIWMDANNQAMAVRPESSLDKL